MKPIRTFILNIGETLNQIKENFGMTNTDIAQHMGKPNEFVYGIKISGSVSVDTVIKYLLAVNPQAMLSYSAYSSKEDSFNDCWADISNFNAAEALSRVSKAKAKCDKNYKAQTFTKSNEEMLFRDFANVLYDLYDDVQIRFTILRRSYIIKPLIFR